MPKNILCAVDGSHIADRAAACAAELASQTGAKLTFVNVNTVPSERMAQTYFWDEQLVSAIDAQIHSQLALATKTAAKHGVAKADAVVVTGSKVAAAIVAYADAKQFDHIVMGTGVTTELERLFLGSVATDVVARAHCPVTIVR
ncbi:MAG TPA: universal stress protein [Dongiaceae bacterium]|nr:universal stress protein [Dongiaceae bacterium]